MEKQISRKRIIAWLIFGPLAVLAGCAIFYLFAVPMITGQACFEIAGATPPKKAE